MPVLVTVTDSQNRLVPGLLASDFEIVDNGTARPTVSFVPPPRSISFVLMIDTSASMGSVIAPVKAAAAQFLITSLRRGDQASVAAISQRTAVGPRFTDDGSELIAALRTFVARGSTYLWDGLAVGIDAVTDHGTEAAIVVVTDGGDTESVLLPDEIIRRTRIRNVMVDVVELPDQIRPRSGPDRDLRAIAEDSGGGYIQIGVAPNGSLNPGELSAALMRLVDELRSQYVVWFRPGAADGRPHTLSVRIKKPGLNLRARRTFVAAPKVNPVAAR